MLSPLYKRMGCAGGCRVRSSTNARQIDPRRAGFKRRVDHYKSNNGRCIMARATTETLLPLATWAKIMQLNPWEFEQIGTGFPQVNHAQCDHVFFQYSWQQD